MKRVDKRRWLAAGIVAATALQAGAAGVIFWLRDATEQSVEATRRRVGELEEHLAELEMKHEEQVAVPVPVSRWRIADAADVSGTLQIVQAAGDAAGVEISGLGATQSKTPGRQTFVIAGAGRPQAVCELIAALEQRDTLILVESGRILPATADTVAFEFGLAAPYAMTAEARR